MVRVLFFAAWVAAAPVAHAQSVPAPAPIDQAAAPAPVAPPNLTATPPAAPAVPRAAPTMQPDKAPFEDAAPEGAGYLLFKTLIVLGVVVAVIYLTLNVGARKLLKLGPRNHALVKVIDRVPLDAKKHLYVLQVGAEYLLVGAGETGFTLLSKLEPEGVQRALEERLQARPQVSFLERLNTLAKPAPKKPQ